MHFDFLPKVTHNEDAVREHERAENRRVRRWLILFAIALLLLGILAGLVFFLR